MKWRTKRKTETMRITLGVGVGLSILWIAHFFATILISDRMMAVGIAFIIFSIIYFRWLFPYFTCIVPADRAWVISNSLVSESSKKRTEFSGYREIKAQRELQAGFHWRFPWENSAKVIDMTRLITVESDETDIYTLKGGKEFVIISWRIFYGPLPGSIVNYIKTRPMHITTRISDRARTYLQGAIGKLKEINFDKAQQESLRNGFEAIYKGPEHIDTEEEELGVWTGTPNIIDIDQPKTKQEISIILDTVMKAVKDSNGEMTFAEARDIILGASTRGVDYNIVDIKHGGNKK